MKLSTEVNDQHVIIFHDKSRKWVTKAQAEFIFQSSAQTTSKGITIAGSYYTFSSIAKMLSAQEFYEQFPKERPEEVRNEFAEKYPEFAHGNQQIRQPTERAKEMMKQGFIGQQIGIGKTREEAEDKFKSLFQS